METNNIIASGKVVLVGDGGCGKTCLLEVFRRNKFPEEYVPTVVDNFVKEVKLPDGGIVSLTLWDTAGQEDYDSVRPLSYKDTDLVILCYSIENKDLLENVTKKWVLEIGNYCPKTEIFLVALKKDIRGSPDFDQNNLITEEDGLNASKEIHATRFFECSAKTGENLNVIFQEVGKFIANKNEKNSQSKGFFSMCCG
ncbi:Ras-like GTP-binding protein RHO [Dictyocoela muelleri]|nr:Ras-like GTP-binding protein RHO [Dictyocoela muelleri]